MNPSQRSLNFNSRRSLLKAAGTCGLMTNTSLMATLLNLQATKSILAAESDTSGYKALVCLFLSGGNDSYNMLVPNEGDATSGEYGHYYDIRGGFDNGSQNQGGLALDQGTLVPINGPDARSFGLHPGFASELNADPTADPTDTGIAGLYKTNKLGFVANIGSLLERTTRASYNARASLPLGLFSHADLQRHWQTGFPQSRSKITGWGGRMADLLQGTNANPAVSMNISLGGMNLYQTGDVVVPYAIGTGGATVVNGYSPGYTTSSRQNRMYSRALDNVLDQTYSDLLAKSFAETTRLSTDAALNFNTSTGAVNFDTEFADESPSSHLKMVAKCIGAREELGQTRQIFFIRYGGWDNHDNLISSHNTRLPRISRALTSFQKAMEEIGCANDVTLFTASDFARTLGTNGKGSDHAWGGNHIVMGGSVDGGKFYGDYPDELSPSNELNLGRGRFIPTTSVDEMAAELAMWFGVSNNSDLVDVLPNIREFYAESAGGNPLGFLA